METAAARVCPDVSREHSRKEARAQLFWVEIWYSPGAGIWGKVGAVQVAAADATAALDAVRREGWCATGLECFELRAEERALRGLEFRKSSEF